MSDGKVEIDTSINTEGAESGIKKLTNKLNALADNKALTSLSKLGMAFNGVTSAFGLITKAVGTTINVMKDLSATSQKQVKAEKQLESAAKNNPYLNKSSVNNLKSYASQLQKIGTIGDEELLPMMAQLAAAGRTESEIMDIMTASLDISASGTMSLESAVKNLNKTFSGLSGELGESIPQIKSMTTEELKSGKAVEVLKAQYAGMAESTTKAAGYTTQLANAWGDLKESIGKGFNVLFAPAIKFFTWAIERATALAEKFNEIAGFSTETPSIKQSDSIASELKALQAEREELNKRLNLNKQNLEAQTSTKEMSEEELQIEEAKQAVRENIAVKEGEIKRTEDEILKNEAKKIELQQKQKDLKDELNAKINSGAEIDNKYYRDENRNIEDQIKVIDKANKQLNKNLKTAKDELSSYSSSFIESTKDTSVALKEEIETETTELASLDERIEAKKTELANAQASEASGATPTKTLSAEELNAYKALLEDLALEDTRTLKQQTEDLIAEYDKQVQYIQESDLYTYDQKVALADQWAKKREELSKKVKQLTDEENEEARQKGYEAANSVLSAISNGLSELEKSFSTLKDSMSDYYDNEEADDLEDLNQQYSDGLISYEDYIEGKEKLDKEYAEKKYQLEVADWALQLAQATANIAQGITADLAKGGTLGAITAATTAVLGAAQIATIVASKPKKTFASGGIVGASMGADNTYAQVRNGEMILNAEQQLQLWKTANGLGSGNSPSVYLPINIENNTSASVNASVSEHEIKITVDNIVRSSLTSGSYDTALSQQQANVNGRTIL